MIISVPMAVAALCALPLVPWPSSVTTGSGLFTLTAGTTVVADAALAEVAEGFARLVRPATGFTYVVRASGRAPAAGASSITFRLDASLARTLGDEGYRLQVEPTRVVVQAAHAAGAFHAVQSLRQLLPAAIERQARVSGVAWTIPVVRIEDVPRFAWRGAHLDVSRHFMPVAFVKRYIDLMALHKLNRFHWHLTDDQGWRIEIKKYPRLTEVGAWRKETIIGRHESDPAKRRYDATPHGGFYTQDDIREVVAYAAERFITVVPEIEMPGHAQAAIAAYPELGNTSRSLDVLTSWGVSDDVFNASPATVSFLQDVLAEVLELFPSPWIHVGGDEVPKTQWQQNPAMQAQIKQLGLKDEHELQSWFITQMDKFLTAKGRRLVGWDEILEGGLAPNATVMSWRGDDGAIAAANAGHDAILTPTHHTYFDYYQSKDRTKEPLAIGGFLPLDTVYTWDPIPKAIAPDKVGRILGVQAQVWTEYILDGRHVEYMAFPRLAALAEVGWTPAAGRDLGAFRARMVAHEKRLRVMDVNSRPVEKP